MKRIAVLGSTGSIGVSTLDVARTFPDRFDVVALAAGGRVDELAEQIREFRPTLVSVRDAEVARELEARLDGSVHVTHGSEGLDSVALHDGVDMVRHKLDVLRRHCDDVGRSFESIERTTLSTANLTPGGQSPRDVIEHCRELASVGVQQAIFNMPRIDAITPLETFAKEIIPEVGGF